MSNVISSYINGNHRTTIYTDGTKVKETGYYVNEPGTKGSGVNRWVETDSENFIYEVPENITIKITDFCNAGCQFCSEGSNGATKHADLSKLSPMIDSFYPGLEVNITGGNPLAHPELITILEILKARRIIVNLNINQVHIKKNKDLIKKLIDKELIYGLGITLHDAHCKEDFKFIDKLGDRVIIHVIAGILNRHDLPALQGRRILIQGFKKTGRGKVLFEKHKKEIEKNISWLQKKIPALHSMCKIINFDILGFKQINPARVLHLFDVPSDSVYNIDGIKKRDTAGNIIVSDLYIDMPNMEVSISVDMPKENFHKITGQETISELLNISTL